jgi:hypothetical protein
MLSDIHKLKHFEVFQDPAKYFLPRIWNRGYMYE